DDGADGSYSDWYGSVIGTGERAPAWETYHVKELIPFIDATFPTAVDRSHRFIAGLSSGGHGAMKYAAIYPQLFGAAGEFSGALDVRLPLGARGVRRVGLELHRAPRLARVRVSGGRVRGGLRRHRQRHARRRGRRALRAWRDVRGGRGEHADRDRRQRRPPAL